MTSSSPRHRTLFDVRNIVRLAIEKAKKAGLDYPSQSIEAAKEIMKVRPDITKREALTAAEQSRQLNNW